ncbi:hypothetical protein GUITHDRAFT_142465 [Guillardia theta CCMP2712]|uniref:Uncharacterized protein n=1 Tax=Guillardia theta (strain CCMP2712) TaxID=905079 RepID=L1IXA4_GUITC|nr:hypothetical protein GUITHDRAFT_142465 [Guillardia theta CCMP2712]EKX40846.1 hypothetical protein GUITHDRAFT_142465 [Guillardia theta CCMP2712]|eukprot:XP_005827826.1 hypothetical protein GUITHDRAFT_142465 [Guillardia theta CCMP2712]
MTAVMGASKSVYLSVVMVMRNDNYGENLLHRFNRTIASLSESASLYRLDYEIIVVEWDPPGSRPLLREALVWPKNIPRLHIITVPQHVHKEVNCRGWEYEAKNLGISQAEGSFILCMNCDVILSPRLVKFLSEKTLKDDCYYRVDRYDCIELIPESMTAVQAAKHCQDHSVSGWNDSPFAAILGIGMVSCSRLTNTTEGFKGIHIVRPTAIITQVISFALSMLGFLFERISTDSYLVAAAAAKANCSSENWMRFQAAASRMLAGTESSYTHALRFLFPVQTPITTNDLHGWHLDASTCDLFNISTVPSALSASKSSKDDPNDDEFRANYLCSGKTHIRGPWKRLEAYLLVANGLASQGIDLLSDSDSL